MTTQAREARSAGRRVFVVKLNWPWTKGPFGGGLSGHVVDWSLMIEAIEREGWALDNLAAMNDRSGRPEALLLFRPAEQAAVKSAGLSGTL